MSRKYQPHHFGSMSVNSEPKISKEKQQFLFSSVNENVVENFLKQCFSDQSICYKIQRLKDQEYLVTINHQISKNLLEESFAKVINSQNFLSQITFVRFQPKDERNIYVTNLPIQYEDDQLRTLFQEYGDIISVKLVLKFSNKNKIGFVRFRHPAEANNAIEQVNSRSLILLDNFRPVHCELSKANTKTTSTSDANRPSLEPFMKPTDYSGISIPSVMGGLACQNPVLETLDQSMARMSVGPSLTFIPDPSIQYAFPQYLVNYNPNNQIIYFDEQTMCYYYVQHTSNT